MRVCFGEARVRLTWFWTAVCLKAAGCARPRLALPCGSDGRETEKKLDSCRLGADCVPMGISEQEMDSPWASIPNSDEPTENAALSLTAISAA